MLRFSFISKINKHLIVLQSRYSYIFSVLKTFFHIKLRTTTFRRWSQWFLFLNLTSVTKVQKANESVVNIRCITPSVFFTVWPIQYLYIFTYSWKTGVFLPSLFTANNIFIYDIINGETMGSKGVKPGRYP